MRRNLVGPAGLLLALAIAGSASAATVDRFSFEDVLVNTYSCGVTLTTRIAGEGAAHLTTDGNFAFATIRFRVSGVAVDPSTGASMQLDARQILIERADAMALVGQGTFIHVAGEGVLLGDVGRLVFDPATGETLHASAHVVRFDDPASADRIDAAICALFD